MRHIQFAVLVTLFSITGFALPSHAQTSTIVQRLEQEEQTWHKYGLFTITSSLTDTDEYIAAMGWLRDRILAKRASDSRYAITYSSMLWRTKNPNLANDALVFAVVGYWSLQLDTARCEDRQTALAIARQWYDPVRAQIQAFRALPKNDRAALQEIARKFITGYVPNPESNKNPGHHWLCYLLPAYTSQILRDPAVVTDEYSRGPFKKVFVGHPTLQPAFASEEAFNRSEKIIANGMQDILNPEQK